MVNNCANPECAKPLHYLREGRIFVFDVTEEAPDAPRRLEHYWLCGTCSEHFVIQKDSGTGIHLVPRRAGRMAAQEPEVIALAS